MAGEGVKAGLEGREKRVIFGAIGRCYHNHFRMIVLQLVESIATTLWSCISIDSHCNYLVPLQPYWIWLLLLATIVTFVLGGNNLQGCCNR